MALSTGEKIALATLVVAVIGVIPVVSRWFGSDGGAKETEAQVEHAPEVSTAPEESAISPTPSKSEESTAPAAKSEPPKPQEGLHDPLEHVASLDSGQQEGSKSVGRSRDDEPDSIMAKSGETLSSQLNGNLEVGLIGLRWSHAGVVTATLRLRDVSSREGLAVALKAVNSDGIMDFWKFMPRPSKAELTDETGNVFRFDSCSGVGFAKDSNDWLIMKPGDVVMVSCESSPAGNASHHGALTLDLEIWLAKRDSQTNEISRSAVLIHLEAAPNANVRPSSTPATAGAVHGRKDSPPFPICLLSGDWEANIYDNQFTMRIKWDAEAGEMKGSLTKNGARSGEVGFQVGELIYVARLSENPGVISERGEWRSSQSSSEWRSAQVDMSTWGSSEKAVFYGGTEFHRLGTIPQECRR